MDRHQGRVLIRVGQILPNVLDDQLIALGLHKCVYERRQIEVRAAVEVQLVLNDLVHSLWVCARLGDLEFWHLGAGGVAGAIDVVVGRGPVVVAAPFAEGGDEFIGVDLERLLVVEIEGLGVGLGGLNYVF